MGDERGTPDLDGYTVREAYERGRNEAEAEIERLREALEDDAHSGEPWEQGKLAAQRLNELLHEGIGESPCETGCTHELSSEAFPGVTMLGIANVFGRAVEQAISEKDAPLAPLPDPFCIEGGCEQHNSGGSRCAWNECARGVWNEQ